MQTYAKTEACKLYPNLEYFEYFCQISSKSIFIILTFTVSKLVRFLKHSVHVMDWWHYLTLYSIVSFYDCALVTFQLKATWLDLTFIWFSAVHLEQPRLSRHLPRRRTSASHWTTLSTLIRTVTQGHFGGDQTAKTVYFVVWRSVKLTQQNQSSTRQHRRPYSSTTRLVYSCHVFTP